VATLKEAQDGAEELFLASTSGNVARAKARAFTWALMWALDGPHSVTEEKALTDTFYAQLRDKYPTPKNGGSR
jgi:hypothetical protein